MLEQILFLIVSFVLFMFMLYKILAKNDTNYIILIVLQALGIGICSIEISMHEKLAMFFRILKYIFSIVIPIIILYFEKKGTNFSEIVSIVKVKFFLLLGDKRAAKDVLLKLVSKYSDSYVGHKMLAEIYESEGGMRKAIDEYVLAVDRKKDDSKSYFKIANLLNELDRKDEAIVMLQNLVKVKPESYEGTMLLGELLCEQERFKEAASVYQDGLRYHSADFDIYYNLGIVYTRLNEFTVAKEMYEKAATLNHLLYGAYYNIGQICFIERDLDAAEELFVKCLNSKKLNANAYYQLAKVYALKGQKEKAIEYINKAISLDKTLLKKAEKDKAFEEIKQFITVSVDMNEEIEQEPEIEEDEEVKPKYNEQKEELTRNYLEETYNLVEIMSENTERERAEEKVTNIINKEKLRKMLEEEELEEALVRKDED